MKNALSGKLAFDTSVLIELTFSTALGSELLNLILAGQVEPYTTEVAEAELRYVLCRRVGKDQAEERIAKLQTSGYMTFESISNMIKTASTYKCERALSLADCFCLAQAKALTCPALFATKEAEMANEMRKRAFEVRIIFLQA